MARRNPLTILKRRVDPKKRLRSATLRSFYKTTGLVNFGIVHQHDDEYDPVRGFSSSLTHHDDNYAVGSFNGHDIRVVDRHDTYRAVKGEKKHEQSWVVIEIHLHVRNMPHFFFVPSGVESKAYAQLFAAKPFLQPLNGYVTTSYSPEFSQRYQLIARATKAREVAELVTPTLAAGIATSFWPNGIEVEHGRLYVYVTDDKLTKSRLEQALDSAMWLAASLRENHQ